MVDTQEIQEKVFEPEICFTIFGDWMKAIESAESESDLQSEAYMLFKAIARYSMYGEEPDFDEYTANKWYKAFWPIISNQINSSIDRRKRGFKSQEMTKKQKMILNAYKENPLFSVREIAVKVNVSTDTVMRTRKKYMKEIEEIIAGELEQLDT